MGWRGINIDVDKECIDMFKKYRPDDISICAAISDKEDEILFYKSSHNEVNTLNKDIYDQFSKIWSYDTPVLIKTSRLDSILDKCMIDERPISFLSIDVEGYELEVLRSIDLNKYIPKVIILESHLFELANNNNGPIVSYLSSYNYILKYYSTKNIYFCHSDFVGDFFDAFKI